MQTILTDTQVEPAVEEEVDQELEDSPLYQLILFDDDDHSYEYVIDMMATLFGFSLQQGFKIAHEVDHCGQVVIKVCPYEEAKKGRDQIHSYGADPLMERSQGSMSAYIEPVQGQPS